MANDRDAVTTTERLSRILEIYGADPARWPEPERARLLALISTGGDARTMFDEARALDRLLAEMDYEIAPEDLAPAPVERMIAGAIDRARNRPGELASEVGQPVRSGGKVLRPEFAARRVPGHGRASRATGYWQAAALLAASLVIGVFLGASGVTEPALESFARTAGLNVAGEDLFPEIGADPAAPLEEDLL